jgi:predicted transcriptional regulator
MTNEQIRNRVLISLTNHNQSSLEGLRQVVNCDIKQLKLIVEELILSGEIYMTKTTIGDKGYYIYKLNRKKKRGQQA